MTVEDREAFWQDIGRPADPPRLAPPFRARALAREEWRTALVGTELELGVPFLPTDAIVLVVEDSAGRVVACWSAFQKVHVEGLWLSPALQGFGRGAVGRRLLEAMRVVAEELGARTVVTGAITDDVRALIAQYGGYQLPGTHHVLRVRE